MVNSFLNRHSLYKGSTIIFFCILLFKVILLIIFSSEYSRSLFHPFVSTFIENSLNPWQYYYENSLNLDSFPYHALMLILLYPFTYLSDILSLDFIFKIPLLLADLGVLYILLKLFPHKEKEIFIYYFLNPIVLYAIYIHSQLDIIPTALLLAGIYLLTLKKFNLSAFVIGLAVATKIHIIIALPLVLFYLYKNEHIKVALNYILLTFMVLLFFDFPFLFSEGFIHMVILNPKQSLLFDSFYVVGSIKLLLPIASILMVYFHFFNQDKVNRDLLYFYFGLLFTVTILFIYPAPAWYVWMVPFISIYFIQSKNEKKTLVLYLIFSIAYLIFFIFFYKSEYKDILFLGHEIHLKIDNEKLINISFTFLEMTLLAILYAFYKYGIKSNSVYKKQTNITIGIGGDSGVGKSTLIENLKNILDNKLLQVEGDGEHKWERGDNKWNKFTHLDPKANYIHKQADAMYNLKHNQITYRSDYDHHTGKFTKPLRVEPKEFIVIAGLHPFYLPKMRKIIDLKIYLDTDENLRRHWKIIRDTKKRGYSVQKILEQIEVRMEDARKYIYPQKEFSDLIIKFFAVNNFTLGQEEENIILGLKITFDANIHIEDILDKLDCIFVWDYNDDLKSQYIELKSIPQVNFEDIAIETIENIDEIIVSDSRWESGYEGLIQLISLKMISEKLREGDR